MEQSPTDSAADNESPASDAGREKPMVPPVVYSTTPTPSSSSIWRRLAVAVRSGEHKIWSFLKAGGDTSATEDQNGDVNAELGRTSDRQTPWQAQLVGPLEPTTAPSLKQFYRNTIHPIVARAWGSVLRTWTADIATVKLQPHETAGAAEPSIARYYAWRRSALAFSATFLIITSIYRLATFEAVSDRADRWAEAVGFAWLENLEMSQHNADVLLLLQMLLLGSSIGASLFCGAAAWLTRNAAVSRRWTLIASGMHLLGPALVMAIPFGRFLEGNRAATVAVSSLFAMTVLWTLPPVILALLAGTLRGCFTVKTVVPESPLPGYVVAVVGPVYGLFFLTALCVAGHFGFGPAYFGLLALFVSPMLLGLRFRVLSDVYTLDELGRLRKLRAYFGWITTAGSVLLVIAALNHHWLQQQIADALWKPKTFILQLSSFLANLVLLNVAASDVMMQAIRRIHADYATMHATGRDAALTARLTAYSEIK